jgi:DNA primase
MNNDLAEVKKNTDILVIVGKDKLEKVSSCGGIEYAGACPFCGGEDRFRVQPKHPDGGRWYCRGCGDNKWHDVVDFVMRRDNIQFKEALELLMPEKHSMVNAVPVITQQETRTTVDRKLWATAAKQFTEECKDDLFADIGHDALEYLHGRGLTNATLHRFYIGYNDLEGYGSPREWGLPTGNKILLPRGITIPCADTAGFHYIKVRCNSGDPKYKMLKGSRGWLYGAPSYRLAAIGFLFESELDVLLAWQSQLVLGYASIPAGQNINKEWQQFFGGIEDVIVAYDNDGPGQEAADKLCKQSTHFYKANPLPSGKDLTEYRQGGGDVFGYLYDQLSLIRCSDGP